MTTMNADDAEEYTQALGQVVAGGWRQVALGERLGVPQALGLSTKEWVEQRLGGYVRMSIPERREAAKELAADGLSQPEIAEVLGVNQATVSRDLHPRNEQPMQLHDGRSDGTEEPQVNQSIVDPPMHLHSDETLGESALLPAGQEVADAILAEIDAAVSTTADAEEPETDEGAAVDIEPAPAPLAVAEPERLSAAAPGWHKLGEHLLYCGDSTDPEFVEACQAAAFAFADPPYNAGKAEWDHDFVWRHDYLADSAAIVAVTPGIAALAGFLADTQMPYQWSMAAEITNGMTAGALRFGNWICVTLFAHGSIYRQAKDHVRIPAATADDRGGSHPSRKPIRLLTHLIELFTTKGDTIVDPFLGSGTTLMAAERTGRRCVGAEIDPMNCAEIIARYRSEAAA